MRAHARGKAIVRAWGFGERAAVVDRVSAQATLSPRPGMVPVTNRTEPACVQTVGKTGQGIDCVGSSCNLILHWSGVIKSDLTLCAIYTRDTSSRQTNIWVGSDRTEDSGSAIHRAASYVQLFINAVGTDVGFP
jgi:hypothetical protein